MKRWIGILFLLGSAAWALADSYPRQETVQSDPAAMALVTDQYTQQIEPFFKEKCAHCHVADPEYPWYVAVPGLGAIMRHHNEEGREDLDFTEGFPFKGKGSLAHRLDELEEAVLDEREMPPLYYRLTHPGSRLSADEEARLKAWLALARGQLGLTSSERDHD